VWLAGLRALADAGPHISCKLSGVAAAAGGLTAAAVRPWVEPAIEVFGVERCLFASNFPVDGLHGTLDELWRAYSEVTDGLSADGRDRLFAANAQRIYRC
jgi:L-fuconolactonase